MRHLALAVLPFLAALACSSSPATPPDGGGGDGGRDARPGDDADGTGGDGQGDATPDAAFTFDPDCDVQLTPGEDAAANQKAIQTALVEASSGDVICFAPGTYPVQLELSLDVDDVELRGPDPEAGTAVLDFAGQKLGGNGLSVTSDGFTLSRLTIKNTPGDGVRVTGAQGVTFREVIVTWDAGPSTKNGAYGLYPVQCTDVLIESCTVSYAADAGIYVGQSTSVVVRGNEVFGNVAGIEFENTVDGEAYDNDAHDNTGGILVFDLPDLPMQGGMRTKVWNNRIVNNNQENFAQKGSIVSIVPQGSGVLVLSTDNNEFHDNVITGNQSLGLAIVSYFLTMRKFDDPTYDPYPEGNFVHDNTFMDNGTDPQGMAAVIAALVSTETVEDMIWDGVVDPKKDNSDGSLTNCFNNNGKATYRNLDAGGTPAFAGTSTDLDPVTCEHEPLPSLMTVDQ